MIHRITQDQFSDVDGWIDLVKPGDRVEIINPLETHECRAVLIHPNDLRLLDRFAEVVELVPEPGKFFLIDEDAG